MATLLEEPPIIFGDRTGESEDQYECETVDGIELARPPMSAREKGIASDLARYLSN